jgi:hypothetical protein
LRRVASKTVRVGASAANREAPKSSRAPNVVVRDIAKGPRSPLLIL